MSHHGHSHGGSACGSAPSEATAATPATDTPPAPRPEPPRRPYCAEEDDSHLVRREAQDAPPSAEAQLQATLAALAAPRPAFAEAALQAAQVAQPLAPDSLPHAWAHAEALYHHIQDNGDAAGCPVARHSPAEHLTEALAAFRACAALIRAGGLFSPNEAVEDVPTAHLRYLLAEYYIAALLVRGLPGPGRAGALRQARLGFEAFVRTCIALGIVSRGEDWGAVLQGQEGEEEGAGSGSGSGGSGGGGGGGGGGSAGPRDGAGQRAAKIERFKRAQAAKRRLAELGALHAAQAARARGGQEGGDDGVGGSASAAGGGVDEDVLREMALLTLASSARSAVEDVGAIDAELPLLAHRAKLEAASAQGRGGSSSSSSSSGGQCGQEWDPRVPPRKAPPPPGDLSLDPARPGIQVTRINPQFEIQEETVKAGIFQSGHLAPTMTMAEWGDHVMDLTLEREARDKKLAARRVQSLEELAEQGKEDNEELMDAATMKKRAFEDWADGVPRGSGNTKRI